MAAPRAEVITRGGAAAQAAAMSSSSSSHRPELSYSNALFDADGEADAAPASIIVRGVLINTGPPAPPQRKGAAAAVPPTAAKPQPLARKLTQ